MMEGMEVHFMLLYAIATGLVLSYLIKEKLEENSKLKLSYSNCVYMFVFGFILFFVSWIVGSFYYEIILCDNFLGFDIINDSFDCVDQESSWLIILLIWLCMFIGLFGIILGILLVKFIGWEEE